MEKIFIGNDKRISRSYHKFRAEVDLVSLPTEKECLIEELFEDFFNKALKIIGNDISNYEENAIDFMIRWNQLHGSKDGNAQESQE